MARLPAAGRRFPKPKSLGRILWCKLPKTQAVILSLHYSDQLAREVVDAGARAYVLKSDASRDLFRAIERSAILDHSSPRKRLKYWSTDFAIRVPQQERV